MTWKTKYTQDTDTPGLGTVEAVFAADNGIPAVVYSGQVDTNDGASIGAFIDAAREALTVAQKKGADESAAGTEVAVKIEAVLNEG